MSTCRHCGGTGFYWAGDLNATPPPCYFCRGTGRA